MRTDATDFEHRPAVVHVYTGNGKGKTTAALGLAIRAAGAGQKVFFAQFLKRRPTSELTILHRLSDRITMRRFGGANFARNGGTSFDADETARSMAEAFEAVWSGQYSVIVLDEINVVLALGLINLRDVLSLIDALTGGMTMVLTGRDAPQPLIDAADLVTEMVEIKHYFRHGVPPLLGIEM